MTSAIVQAVAWLPNGHDGLWVAVRGRVTETPQEWKVTELEVLAANSAPAPFEWLVGHNDPAAMDEVMLLEHRHAWRLDDALVAVFRASHGEPEESEAEVLRRMYGEVKKLRDALVEAVRELKALHDATGTWRWYRNNTPMVKRWAELLGGMPEGL